MTLFMCTALDLRIMLLDMHRMRLELERSLDEEKTLLMREGSVRGRKLHVFNTIRMMWNKSQWKRDYLQEEQNRVVVYITSCGILRRVWKRCRDTVDLLKALNIKAEFRDLNIDPSIFDELIDRMQLDQVTNRELIYESLPMVYVNGKYFGNDSTLIQENEKKSFPTYFENSRDDKTAPTVKAQATLFADDVMVEKKREKHFISACGVLHVIVMELLPVNSVLP
uniref:Glutaredoxin domain-containing protein n=1 Tax=Heterorhabditis bacteriophora TaxID=37862 RepID=A0A1I7WYN2_HETBA